MVIGAMIGSAVIGAAATTSAANKANKTNQAAIAAQESSAQAQQRLAQEQWDYQKDIYLPKSMQMADDSAALTKKVADKQLEASDYYMGVSKDAVGQAKKSYEFQDDYMGLARDYLSGKTANTMANEANANVEQGFANTTGQMTRAAGRMGLDPGSGAFISTLGEQYNQKALASAGAQTNAQKLARDKAEQMVGIAAGSGAAGFGTGMSAGGLATGANSAAVNASTSGNSTLNGVNAGFNSGINGASAGFGGSVKSWNSAVQTGQQHPWADMAGGLASSGLKAFGSFSGFSSSPVADLRTSTPDTYAPGSADYNPQYGP